MTDRKGPSMRATSTISTAELRDRLADPGLTIVDVRPLAAYNGWRLGDEARGGHIPGAVAFPSAWLTSVDAPEIAAHPRREGRRTADATSSSTATTATDAAAVAARLARARASTTSASTTTASRPGPRTPACRSSALPKYDSSSTSSGSARCSPAGVPRPRRTGKFLLFHVNFGVPEEYAEGHIPGALYLDTNWLEDPADWNRRSPEELDDGAPRARHHPRHDGHRLRPRHRGRRQREVAGPPGRPDRRDARADDPALRRRRRRPAARRRLRLVGPGRQSARDRRRASRRRSPAFGVADPAAARGHRRHRRRPSRSSPTRTAPPSSASGPGASTSATSAATTTSARPAGSRATSGATAARTPTTCSTTATSTTRCAPTRRSRPTGRRPGSRADKWVAFYCGTGWRASETWFYAYLQGWQRIAVYDGGWFEWSQDPINNPIEIGDPDHGGGRPSRATGDRSAAGTLRACLPPTARSAWPSSAPATSRIATTFRRSRLLADAGRHHGVRRPSPGRRRAGGRGGRRRGRRTRSPTSSSTRCCATAWPTPS